MSITAVIPARKGSKGIPNKNIIELFGKPLIYWTISKALKSKCFNSVIVSTDCENIANISKSFGAEVPFLRPSQYATDNASRNDVISHIFKNISHCESIVYLQPTSPFRSTENITNFIKFINSNHLFPVISLKHITDNSSTVLIESLVGKWEYLNNEMVMNRQSSKSKIYKMDGCFFYINRKYWDLMRDKSVDYIRTKDTRYYINPNNSILESLDIDTRLDLNFARSQIMTY